MFERIRVRSHEIGLRFVENELTEILRPGVYRIFSLFGRKRIDVLDRSRVWVNHENLDVMAKSGKLGEDAEILELSDNQRAIVRIDGRIDRMLGPGRHVMLKGVCDIKTEIFDTDTARFEHRDAVMIAFAPGADRHITEHIVPQAHAGVLYLDGKLSATLPPGRYFFWKDAAKISMFIQDLRERVMDISGQEIMTSDKVTLRMNVTAAFRVKDVRLSVEASSDSAQALYRDIQLALRTEVGRLGLDDLLSEKDSLAGKLMASVSGLAREYGLSLERVGMRDIILPGEMKELMNQVIEAEKAAKANLIRRREETAAMRSQANTAKLLEDNPVLMRLRELETLESVAKTAKLNVFLGEKGLGERIVNII